MTLTELIEWIDAAIPRLRPKGVRRARVKQFMRMYDRLNRFGVVWEWRRDWHTLAQKIAVLLDETAPDEPSSPGEPRVDESPRALLPYASGDRSSYWRRRFDAELARAGGVAFDGDEEEIDPELLAELITAENARGASKRRDREAAHGRGAAAKRKKHRRIASRPEREPIQINEKLQAAFDAVAQGRPIIFVTGGAGTGKSTFIRELRARFPEKQSIVLAPTGVAALNAGGQTIHSFCHFPLRPVMPTDAKRDQENEELIRKLDLVIIDEISMVRADVLDGVDAFLRVNRESQQPFGGVQMVLVGDLFQLPPVVTPRDEQEIVMRYRSPFFFAARCLTGLKFRPIELEIVYRQRDSGFAALLGRLRDGDGMDGALRELNERCAGRSLKGRHVILTPTRKAAADENDARLAALPNTATTFDAEVTGTFIHAPEDRLPGSLQLTLKKNAQVMFVRNDYPEKRWVNGTIGTVTSVDSACARVRLEDGSVHEVEAVEWQDIRYGLNETTKTIQEEIVGTFKQLPLILAWAVTIHKAQGLTLERVEVDLGRGAFAEGQVYVALSRCQSLEGLSLRRPIRVTEVRVSEHAREFYDRMRRRRGAVSSESIA